MIIEKQERLLPLLIKKGDKKVCIVSGYISNGKLMSKSLAEMADHAEIYLTWVSGQRQIVMKMKSTAPTSNPKSLPIFSQQKVANVNYCRIAVFFWPQK